METHISESPAATQRIGEAFAKRVKDGGIVALYGELGSGKTTFVQGLAKGLGITKRIISPTFVIVRSYEVTSSKYSSRESASRRTNREGSSRQARTIHFYHIDLYRIDSQRDLDGLGLEEIFNDSNSIIAIEWAEKMGRFLLQKRIDVSFRYIGEQKREVKVIYFHNLASR